MDKCEAREAFKARLAEQLKLHEYASKKQEHGPSEKRLKDMIEAEHKLFQMVMDSVDEVEYFIAKLKRISEFRDVLAGHYGEASIKVEYMVNIVQERMLLVLWGCDNPHDPFYKLDKDK